MMDEIKAIAGAGNKKNSNIKISNIKISNIKISNTMKRNGRKTLKVDKVLKPRKSNKWIAHVHSVSKAKGISYKEALKEAKHTYNKT
jgi:hypothetical protein